MSTPLRLSHTAQGPKLRRPGSHETVSFDLAQQFPFQFGIRPVKAWNHSPDLSSAQSIHRGEWNSARTFQDHPESSQENNPPPILGYVRVGRRSPAWVL